MRKLAIVLFSFLLATAALARPDWDSNPIRLHTDDADADADADANANAFELYPVRVRNCASWRLAVEAHNALNWKLLPKQCVVHVANYMINKYSDQTEDPQYDDDVDMVVELALQFLHTVIPTEGGKDTWLFDLTDTLISDIEYYNRSDILFGATRYNKTKYDEWFATGNMPAVPHVAKLFYAAKAKGFKIVILSGTSIKFKSVVESNLKKAHFVGWDRLILKDKSGMPTKDFKASTRAQLKKEGYKVIGNIGDQWTDLLTGTNAGKRVFKLPNPMYYVS